MRQIIRWSIIALLAMIEWGLVLGIVRSLVVGNSIFTQALWMVLVTINIVAVVKMWEKWIIPAIISSLIMLGVFIFTSIESYSISIVITSVTLWYLVTGLKINPKIRNTP